MRAIGSLARTIERHPWSSFQDASLLAAGMLVCALLAFEYDIVEFWDELSPNQRRIRLEEMLLLTLLLGVGVVGFILRRLGEQRADIESRIRAEYELRAMRTVALQDPLTTLPNRRELDAALAVAVTSAAAGGQMHALFLLDLNGFKRINDEHGHGAGDEVLRAVAQRLRAAARAGDLVARLGGDEFAVVALAVEGQEAVLDIGNRLVAALHDDIEAAGRAYRIGVSVGAALCPRDGRTAADLMRRADLAMYQAKASKSSALRVFEAEGEDQDLPHLRSA